MKKLFLLMLLGFYAQAQQPSPYNANSVFEQLGAALPTPNTYRSASGAPGKGYWQQKADYQIKVELDDQNQRIIGSEKITYNNLSPDALSYLWLQLDQNNFSEGSIAATSRAGALNTQRGVSAGQLKGLEGKTPKDYGHKIRKVTDASGKALHYVINGTMMRVDLPTKLQAKQSV